MSRLLEYDIKQHGAEDKCRLFCSASDNVGWCIFEDAVCYVTCVTHLSGPMLVERLHALTKAQSSLRTETRQLPVKAIINLDINQVYDANAEL